MDLLANVSDSDAILAVTIAILSWIGKNYFVGYLVKRDEAARKEWEFRLMSIWNPLFFWSGVALFDSQKKDLEDPKTGLGVKELSSVLEKAAHLLPNEHYYAFVKILEVKMRQKEADIDLDRLKRARAYVYGQIETYNYILYGRFSWFQPRRHTDPIGSVREFLRWFAEFAWHIIIWGSVFALLTALLLAVTQQEFHLLLGFAAAGLLLATMYVYWRFRAHRAVTIRQQLRGPRS